MGFACDTSAGLRDLVVDEEMYSTVGKVSIDGHFVWLARDRLRVVEDQLVCPLCRRTVSHVLCPSDVPLIGLEMKIEHKN